MGTRREEAGRDIVAIKQCIEETESSIRELEHDLNTLEDQLYEAQQEYDKLPIEAED